LVFTGLHGVISQKTKLFIVTTVRTSETAKLLLTGLEVGLGFSIGAVIFVAKILLLLSTHLEARTSQLGRVQSLS
jgi:hypothetical protein